MDLFRTPCTFQFAYLKIPVKILSFNQNINKTLSADWSVWNLRGKTIKTKNTYPKRKLRDPKQQARNKIWGHNSDSNFLRFFTFRSGPISSPSLDNSAAIDAHYITSGIWSQIRLPQLWNWTCCSRCFVRGHFYHLTGEVWIDVLRSYQLIFLCRSNSEHGFVQKV